MEACGITDEGTNNEQNHNTYLWNGMIHPLLQVSSHWLITIILSYDWLITTILTSDWLITTIITSYWMITTILSSDWLITTNTHL